MSEMRRLNWEARKSLEDAWEATQLIKNEGTSARTLTHGACRVAVLLARAALCQWARPGEVVEPAGGVPRLAEKPRVQGDEP